MRRFGISLVLGTVLCGFASPVFINSDDPFLFPFTGGFEAYQDTNNNTVVTSDMPGGTNLVIMIVGEGNVTGVAHTAYTPANPTKIFNINIFDGATYVASDPLLGTTPWGIDNYPDDVANFALRLADKFITNGVADNVFLVPIGIFQQSVSTWSFNSALIQRVAVAKKRLQARGIPLHAILWGGGESDSHTFMPAGVYEAAFMTIVSNGFVEGMDAPWYVALQSYQTCNPGCGSAAASPIDGNIRAAQANVVDNVTIFQGPDADTIGSTDRCNGGFAHDVYWCDSGSEAYAQLWYDKLHSYGPPF